MAGVYAVVGRDSAAGGTADFLRWRVALARDDTAALARVREAFDSVPGVPIGHELAAAVTEAQVPGRNGDPAPALAAARRRPYGPNAHLLLRSSLELQGDLAARVGRREEAIEAYRHYLALRSDPEPALKAEVERVREALTALVAREAT